MQGISRTLWEEVKFDNKTVTSVDWMTYPILDITETPETIDIVLINHPEIAPTGAGEPSMRPRRRRDRQRDLRRHRRAHPPRAVHARPGASRRCRSGASTGRSCRPVHPPPCGEGRRREARTCVSLLRGAPGWGPTYPTPNPSPQGGEGEQTEQAARFVIPIARMIVRTLDEAIAPITDGCVLAVPRDVSGVAMAATRALIRRGVKRLTLVALPTSSLQADLLIGAGCVETLETSAVSLGELGPAPRFTAADDIRHAAHEGRHLPGAACRASRRPRRACRSCRCAA